MNITERMAHFHVPGAAVAAVTDGTVAWARGFGTLLAGAERPVDGDSIFHACSMSKMVTALTVLRLAQAGALSLDTDVNRLLTSWRFPDLPGARPTTLADLLAHQGGLTDVEGSFGPVSDGDRPPSSLELLTGVTPYHPAAVAPLAAPGTQWEYSDAGYVVISQAVSDATGQAVTDHARRLVFEPLGLRHTFFWPAGAPLPPGVDEAAVAVGHGNHGEVIDQPRAAYPNPEGAGLWTSAADLARIITDLLASWHGEGGVVLDSLSARRMLTGYGCEPEMGLGVFVFDDADGHRCFFSQGWGVGAQSRLRADLDARSAVIVLTNSEPGMDQDESLVGELIAAVRDGGLREVTNPDT
ncbi:MAG: beta-lactamase family protein [Promicromonosporaceae bacterium]|nr:beta-lactamase family protein [Promicromonosporaceae bacterium]